MQKNNIPHVGMRIWKSAIAAAICAILGYFLNVRPFYAIIAAILCMQSSTGESIKKGAVRLIGTGIGGVFAVFILLLMDFTPMHPFSLIYYLIISLCVVPLIYVNVLFGKEASAYITCVVFFSIVLTHYDADNHYLFALQRMLETAAGIIISLAVNMTIKNNDHNDSQKGNTL